MAEDFLKEELRGDYLVTTDAKKVWAAELNILRVFDKICNDNNLKYFAAFGTLIGAVRHNGFIPWDDDLDVFMLRDDYDKFVSLTDEYIKEPYVFQGIDNGFALSAHTKIRDSRTTAIEYKDAPSSYNQGIFIDVFPLDDANDGEGNQPLYHDIQKLMWQIASHPKEMAQLVRLGQKFVLDSDLILDLCKAGPFETLKQIEIFNADIFGQSSKVNFLTDEIYNLHPSYEREWFSEVKYVPFEDMEIPIPIGYDAILRCQYGDYMTPKRVKGAHTIQIMDPDKPYTEYIH